MSVGGNNALSMQHLLDAPVTSTAQALDLLRQAVREFEQGYRQAVRRCLVHALPLTVYTVYNGNFPDPGYQRRATTALAIFNDAILRTASENRIDVIDLRRVYTRPEDYANAIEPSGSGGARIARAIFQCLKDPVRARAACLVGP